MRLNRPHVALAAIALALTAGWLFAPAGAQSQSSPATFIPCRISWEFTTKGSAWFTVKGGATLSQMLAPQPDGSFIAIGHGTGEVTYQAPNDVCAVMGDTFTAQYMVSLESHDGRNAEAAISSLDQPHALDVLCPPGRIPRSGVVELSRKKVKYSPPALPAILLELREGVQPFSREEGVRTVEGVPRAGEKGTMTLHYCTPERANGR